MKKNKKNIYEEIQVKREALIKKYDELDVKMKSTTKQGPPKSNIDGLQHINEQIQKFVESSTSLLAGVAKVNSTLPLGTPLAGYNHGDRRVPFWPIPCVQEFTTWMMPSLGTINTLWAKALILMNGNQSFVAVTLDAIGSDGTLNNLAYQYAEAQGFPIPFENIIFLCSHSHSGPGAVSDEFLWEFAPATDLVVPELQELEATYIAEALLEAYNNLQPAVVGIGMANLTGVTVNRRASFSPYVLPGTIDPHLGVIRVDSTNGTPLATLWNFAIHGVCYGDDNMYFSGDIMGVANEIIEQDVGGVALFMNGDAGDIDPGPNMCNDAPNFNGSGIMAKAVVSLRANITAYSEIEIVGITHVVPFGPTDLNATLARFDNCSSGGYLDICSLCAVLDCDLNAHLYSNWIENSPRFTAYRITINGVNTVFASIPGEALVELGWWIRNDTWDLGFDLTFLSGYCNNHMGYFATPDEYDVGGYESEMTFWGIKTAEMVREGCYSVTSLVVPPNANPKKKSLGNNTH